MRFQFTSKKQISPGNNGVEKKYTYLPQGMENLGMTWNGCGCRKIFRVAWRAQWRAQLWGCSACAFRASYRDSVPSPGPNAASSVLQFVHLKSIWRDTMRGAGTMGGMWPSGVISSVYMQLSLQASSFFVFWRAAACLWIGKTLSQLLRAGPGGEGRVGRRAFCSDLISREMHASSWTPHPCGRLRAAKLLFALGCLEVLLPPFLLETNPSINTFILELCWHFLTAKATWQYWKIPTSCKELGNSSAVFSFHCLLVYKKMVTKLFSRKASKALDVVRQWISYYFSNKYLALHEQWI